MATTPGQVPSGQVPPGQVPPGSGAGQQSVASMVGIPSTVQRVEVPVNAIPAGSGTTMVRVSQATTPQPGSTTPQPGSATPQPQPATPQPGSLTPQPQPATPQPQPATPGAVVGQSGVVTRPQIVATTPGGGHGTIFQTPVGNLQSLGLMVTRFPTGDNSRPQIILQSRTGSSVRSGPVVVTSTSGHLVHQTAMARTPIGTSGIRTAIVHSGSLGPGTVAVAGGGHGHGHGVIGSTPSGSASIQVMNLSAVPSSNINTSTGQMKLSQQGGTTFISRFGGQTFDGQAVKFDGQAVKFDGQAVKFDGQTVNLILSDTNRAGIRLSPDLMKTVQGGGKYPRMQGLVPSNPKIVNLGPPVSATPIGVSGSVVGVSGSVVGVSGNVVGMSGNVVGMSGNVIGTNPNSNPNPSHPQVTRLNIIHPGTTHTGTTNTHTGTTNTHTGTTNTHTGNTNTHPMVVGGSSLPTAHGTQLVGVAKQGGVINISPVGPVSKQGQGQQTVILNPATNQFITTAGSIATGSVGKIGTQFTGSVGKIGTQFTGSVGKIGTQFMTTGPTGGKIGQGVKTTVVTMNQGGGIIGGQSIHGNHPAHTVINASGLRGITVPSSIGTVPSSIGTVPSSIGTVPSSIGTVPSSIRTVPSSVGTVGGSAIVSHGIVSQNSSSIHRHPSVVAMNASPMKTSTSALIGGHVQPSVTGSPIKSVNVNPVHGQTPPSPRPSILTRKRNLGDGSQTQSSLKRNLGDGSQTQSSLGRNLGDGSQTQSSLGRSPIKPSPAEGLAAKVEAELATSESDLNHRPVSLTAATTTIPSPSILPGSSSSSLQSGHPGSAQSTVTGTQSTLVPHSSDGTATPRKKPRKQLLEPFNLSTSANMKLLTATGSSDEGTHFGTSSNASKEGSKRQIEPEDGDDSILRTTEVDPVLGKKFRPALYQSVIPPWKSLQHHFLRYTDVKPRPEKRMTLAELSNEGLQKKNGWKIHHLATQMEEMGEDEAQVLDRLRKLLAVLEEKSSIVPSGFDLNNGFGSTQNHLDRTLQTPEKVVDLIRGNLQRSNIFKEQMNESQQLLVKLTNDHREKVAKLTKKNMHKRTCIAK